MGKCFSCNVFYIDFNCIVFSAKERIYGGVM